MNTNHYQKVVHVSIQHKDKFLLSQRLKKGFGYLSWSDPGGKIEKKELPIDACIREIEEETGLRLDVYWWNFNFIDCFIYPDRKIKTFCFQFKIENRCKYFIPRICNPEPKKQSDWKWFTKKEALKLELTPSVRYYLENL